jgi:calcineurin-like phosphoesterase family protein
MYFFTADEHYGHINILKYCNRPFSSIDEMNNTIVSNNNSVVKTNDIVIHVGDFTLGSSGDMYKFSSKLSGNHIYIKGSHDKWMKQTGQIYHEIWEHTIEGIPVIACHYAMRVWPRSHYNSWLVYGHSHGRLAPEGKSWDVGVDNNNFYPVSFDQLKKIMDDRPDNFNLVKKSRGV